MDQKIAVLFMPDNIACTEEKTPLMLQPILFCPVLTWMCAELCGRGIERLFIVSDVSAQERMKPYLPKDADVTFVDGAKHAEELLKLLEGETGSILIVNGVVLPVGVFSGGAVYSAPADACCDVLREHGAFAAFPKGCEISKGFLPVGDAEELRAAQPMCRQKIMEKHLANGVIVMDTNSVYIDPRVKIGAGTTLLPGTILRGETVIGEHCTIGPNAMVRDCTVGDFTEINASQTNESAIGSHTTVGPFAYVRPNSTIGDHVKVGDFVEIKNSVIGNGTKISHLRRRQRLWRAREFRLRHGHDELRRLQEIPLHHRGRQLHRLQHQSGRAGQGGRGQLHRRRLHHHGRCARRRAGARPHEADGQGGVGGPPPRPARQEGKVKTFT